MRGDPALMREQGIAKVCERAILLPSVALAIEFLALLVAHDYPLAPPARFLLLGVAAAACLVAVISSVRLFRQRAFVSVLCLLVSVYCLVVGSCALIPIPGTPSPAPPHDRVFLRIARRPTSVNIKKLDHAIAREVGKRRLFDPQFAATQVPEPSTWSLLVLGGVAYLASRRLRRRS